MKMNNISFVFNSMIWRYGKLTIIILALIIIFIIITCFLLALKEVKRK